MSWNKTTTRLEAGEDHREAGVTAIASSPVTSLESGDHSDIISFHPRRIGRREKLEAGIRTKLNFEEMMYPSCPCQVVLAGQIQENWFNAYYMSKFYIRLMTRLWRF